MDAFYLFVLMGYENSFYELNCFCMITSHYECFNINICIL